VGRGGSLESAELVISRVNGLWQTVDWGHGSGSMVSSRKWPCCKIHNQWNNGMGTRSRGCFCEEIEGPELCSQSIVHHTPLTLLASSALSEDLNSPSSFPI
jgi:hypothetical protein